MSEHASDNEEAQPVPEAWRALLRCVVAAFARGDFSLSQGIERVKAISPVCAAQVRDCLASYGETLVELPDVTWETSVAQLVSSGRCDVLVDLWTAESGRSDLVLSGWFDSDASDAVFEVHLVYVP